MSIGGILIGVIVILAVLTFVSFCLYRRRKHIMKKVCSRSDEEKKEDLQKSLEPYGFYYNEKKDIFSTVMYPWQRDMGYCRLYDTFAGAFHMVIDSEPIPFTYEGQNWLIELWKGQYGVTTGAEIGVYKDRIQDNEVLEAVSGRIYESISDEERLCMHFVLRKKGKVIMETEEYHWWLTGFRLGMFSNPKHLTMEATICFPNCKMAEAFVNGLKRVGYRDNEIQICCKCVTVCFKKPKTKQPRWKIICFLAQCMNRLGCGLYRRLTCMFQRTLDKLDYLRFCYPLIYHMIIGIYGIKGHKKR